MPFQKGNTAGKGRPKGSRNKRIGLSLSEQMEEANAAFERLCEKAGLRIEQGIEPAKDDATQVACLKEIMNRAWGKPVEKKEVTNTTHAEKLRELEKKAGLFVDDIRQNAEPIELIEFNGETVQ